MGRNDPVALQHLAEPPPRHQIDRRTHCGIIHLQACEPPPTPFASAGPKTVRHVLFRLDKDRYALPLDAVREVVAAPAQWTRVPHAQAAIKGVMTLRGRVVPVVDLAKLLSANATGERTMSAKVVLLELSRRDLGLLVTDVEGIEPIEKVGPQSRPSRLVRGLTRVGALSVTVLDVEGVDAAVAASFANG
jgi:purine-binding chemotaxis protein CheW